MFQLTRRIFALKYGCFRIDNIEAAILPDERTDLVSTEKAGTWLGIPETGQSASHLPSWFQGCL